MGKNKGFTLVELIVTLCLLVLIGLIVSNSLVGVNKQKATSEYNKFVDRIKSAANHYIINDDENFMLLSGEQSVSVESLLENGLLSEDDIVDPSDNLNVIEDKAYEYRFARVYYNEDEAIEVEYPYNPGNYLRITPKVKVSSTGITTNLLDGNEVFICDEYNNCANSNISNITIDLNGTKITNPNSYSFTKTGDYVLKYSYRYNNVYLNKTNTAVAFRFIKIIDSECTLYVNDGAANTNSSKVNLKLVGSNIEKYRISSTSTFSGEWNTYSSQDIGTYTLSSGNGTKHIYAQCQYSDGAFNKTDHKTINYAFIPTVYSYGFTGGQQSFTVPAGKDGTYKVELWGAARDNKGGYVSGTINLNAGDTFYIYVGQTPQFCERYDWGDCSAQVKGWNGGGLGAYIADIYNGGRIRFESGAGATDIRLIGGSWNDATSLRSRVMVAGGSSGSSNAGGGLTGAYENNTTQGIDGRGGNQIAGGSSSSQIGGFGYGGNAASQITNTLNCTDGYGGGGGWYGGGGGYSIGACCPGTCYGSNAGNGTRSTAYGGGGSSYISGHKGSVGVTSSSNSTPKSGCETGTTNIACSYTYNNKYIFTNTLMIDGNGYVWTNTKGGLQQMPSSGSGYYAGGYGHPGNGFARITQIG